MLNFIKNNESINRIMKIAEDNVESIKKGFKTFVVGIGLVAMSAGSLSANETNQDYLRSITNNSTIELNQNVILESKFKKELNQQFNNWYSNNGNNFDLSDKLKYIVGKNILNSNMSIDDTEEALMEYKKIFSNLKVILTPNVVDTIQSNLTFEQKNGLLEHSKNIAESTINLNEKNLTNIGDKRELNIYKTLAKASLDNELLTNDDKVILSKIILDGSEHIIEKINDLDYKEKLANGVSDDIDNDSISDRDLS